MAADTQIMETEPCPKSHCCLLQKKSFQHFLFNALNSAVSLCGQDPMSAADLLVSISDFLRAGMEEEREQVPLAVELEYVNAYLDIQKVRFEQRLEIDYDIDPQAMCLLPPFTLIQLVDNGVRHGLMSRKAGGRLKISTARRKDRIRILVEDDGVGIPEDVLRMLHTAKESECSLGRLQQRWETVPGARFTIQSDTETGTRITLDLPCLPQE